MHVLYSVVYWCCLFALIYSFWFNPFNSFIHSRYYIQFYIVFILIFPFCIDSLLGKWHSQNPTLEPWTTISNRNYSFSQEISHRPTERSPMIDTRGNSSEASLSTVSEHTAIGFGEALSIPGVIEFSLCLFFAKLVSYTFLFWLPNYIESSSKCTRSKSIRHTHDHSVISWIICSISWRRIQCRSVDGIRHRWYLRCDRCRMDIRSQWNVGVYMRRDAHIGCPDVTHLPSIRCADHLLERRPLIRARRACEWTIRFNHDVSECRIGHT